MTARVQPGGGSTGAGGRGTRGGSKGGGRVGSLGDGEIGHDGVSDTLKGVQDDAREVASGFECGLTLDGFNDVKEGDVLEVYTIKEVARVA